jgi:hypothetical protein
MAISFSFRWFKRASRQALPTDSFWQLTVGTSHLRHSRCLKITVERINSTKSQQFGSLPEPLAPRIPAGGRALFAAIGRMSVCLIDFRSLFDNFAGSIVHLAARDPSFVAISCAPLAKIEFVQEADGLEFPVAVIVWQRLQLRFPRHIGRSHGPGAPDRPVVELAFGERLSTIHNLPPRLRRER